MHCYKSIRTDTLDTVEIAERFACANEFGFVYDQLPHALRHSAASVIVQQLI